MPTRRLLIAAVTVAAALALTACGYDPGPEERRTHLEEMYQQGVKTAGAMRSHGIEATDKSCGDSYISDGLEDRRVITDEVGSEQIDENKVWQQQRRRSYLNGCMGRPNDINATEASSSASPSTSG
jgi:hypothetical protein